MANNIFNINFNKLAQLLLPLVLRKKNITAFLNSFFCPSKTLNNNIKRFRADKQNQMSYNSQVCYMRKMLNDKYDNYLRRITVEQATKRGFLWIYRRAEEKPLILGRIMINRRDVIDLENEFIVNIPSQLRANEPGIRAHIEYYKLATRQYTLKYF